MTDQNGDLHVYKVYLHGEFVALASAMTKGQAVTQVANRYYNSNEYGLMAVQG